MSNVARSGGRFQGLTYGTDYIRSFVSNSEYSWKKFFDPQARAFVEVKVFACHWII
jgi:hypothetical protein